MNFHRYYCHAGFLALLVAGIGCGQANSPREFKDADPSKPTSNVSDLGVILAEPAKQTGGDSQETQSLITAEAVPPDVQAAESAIPSSEGYLSSLAKSLSQAYNSAKSQGLTAATSARDWILDDLNSSNRWEYKVVASSEPDPAKLEQMLNELGRDGWQCFHVQSNGPEQTFYLQRHPSSISRSIPLSDLLKVLPYLGINKE